MQNAGVFLHLKSLGAISDGLLEVIVRESTWLCKDGI